jgi:hypothetical protein
MSTGTGTAIRSGQRLRLADDSEHPGKTVVVWSAAPGTGTYWAHLGDEVVLVQVRTPRNSVPHVSLKEA